MKVSLETVKKYTEITIPQEELVQKVFTQIGAVENVEDFSKKYKSILVAEITEKNDHPDADKLAVYKLDVGDRIIQVVAGDKNLKVGDKVAYFPPGTNIPYNAFPEKFDGIVQKVKLRGVESEGMMASEKELDLGPDHTQVMRLDEKAEVGKSFAEAYDLNDIILDIENKALANRGDLFGVLGVSREIAGIQGQAFKSPKWYSNPETNEPLSVEKEIAPLEIINEAGDNCPRYVAITMDGIMIKDSPNWLKIELIKSGIRPINNVVDITNYLMVLTAQPLHAFDYDKLVNKDKETNNTARIVVRGSKEGESITTLDGKTVKVPEGVTLICDSANPIGIGGMMGGQDTEIDENTKRIIIECAAFNKYNIRRSSMKLGIFTEAVTRFTKSQNPELCVPVIYQAIALIKDLAEGKEASSLQDIYGKPTNPKEIVLDIKRLNTHLGTKFPIDEVKEILERIEYVTEVLNDNNLKTSVPLFRQDIEIAEDIHEDVARQYGFNNIAITLPNRSIMPVARNKSLDFKYEIRKILEKIGGNEILTYNFVGEEFFKKYDINFSTAYQLKNPLSPELEYMRLTPLASVLDKVEINIKNKEEELLLYEINKGHSNDELDKEKLPIERDYLALVSYQRNQIAPYFTAKNYLEKLFKEIPITEINYIALSDLSDSKLPMWLRRDYNLFIPNRSAIIISNETVLGIVGEVKTRIKESIDTEGGLAAALLDIKTLMKLKLDKKPYFEPSKYPSISQDLCIETQGDTPYSKILSSVMSVIVKTDLTFSIEPLDIYQKSNDSMKKTTLRLQFQHQDRTLSIDEITKVKEDVALQLEKNVKGKIV